MRYNLKVKKSSQKRKIHLYERRRHAGDLYMLEAVGEPYKFYFRGIRWHKHEILTPSAYITEVGLT